VPLHAFLLSICFIDKAGRREVLQSLARREMKVGAWCVRPSHILVRTSLSIYSFYLLRCTYSFYYRNPNLVHIYTESAGWLSASVKSSLPLDLPYRGRLPPLRSTSHSYTYNLHRSSMTTSSKEHSCLHHILLQSTPTPLLPFVSELGGTTRPAAPTHSI
jgi:hypothetical protein